MTVELEDNIREMAQALRPKLDKKMPERLRGLPVPSTLDDPSPSAATVARHLEEAIGRARELEKTATVLSMALTGTVPALEPVPATAAPPDFLFGKQLVALSELEQVHTRIRAILERIGRALQ